MRLELLRDVIVQVYNLLHLKKLVGINKHMTSLYGSSEIECGIIYTFQKEAHFNPLNTCTTVFGHYTKTDKNVLCVHIETGIYILVKIHYVT